jgi:hypothetical protein
VGNDSGVTIGLFGVVGRSAVVAACLVVMQSAVAGAHAVVPERVTTGPGDTGQRSYAEIIAASTEGERVVFGSDEPMTPDDRVDGFDLFERVGQTTRLLTPSIDGRSRAVPGYGSGIRVRFVGASQDATRIVFASADRWTADDQDDSLDVFAVEAGRVERVSQGPAGGNTPSLPAGPTTPTHFDIRPPGSAGASLDARRVLFTTAERLTDDDTDSTTDVYAREGNTTTKVSPGNAEVAESNINPAMSLVGYSKDARRVVVGTRERLTADDQDDEYDVFLVDGATTLKLSPGDGPYFAVMHALSDAGHTAVISTEERLLPSDGDARADLYRVVVGAGVQLVSAGPDDVAYDPTPTEHGIYMTPDGRSVVFSSRQRHTPDDTDHQLDTFLWKPERTVKVGRGNGETGPPVSDWSNSSSYPPPTKTPDLYNALEGAATDASKVIVASPERMTPDDLDNRSDLFEVDTRTGNVERVSTGPTRGNADVETVEPGIGRSVVFVSPTASRVVFETQEALVDEDSDQAADVYQRAGGVTTLLSLAPEGSTPAPARWVTGSLDGSVGYLRSQEQLTADDRNGRSDDFRVRLPAPGVVVGKPALSLLAFPSRLRIRSGRVRVKEKESGLPFAVFHVDRITVRIDRVRAGRRVGTRCRRPTAQRRHRRACTRYVPVARHLTFAVREGRHVLVFGRVVRKGHRLRPGRHRVTLKPLGGKAVRRRLTLRR